MSSQPLVTVICLCYNQASFVAEAIQSVWGQNYSKVQLIIVNDGSKDNSKSEINRKIKGTETDTEFIDLSENIGNCRAFNIGLKKAKGEFIIDLAADDKLYSDRITEGLKSFNSKIGVHFCDVMMIDEQGAHLKTHYSRNENGELVDHVPTGNIYHNLIATYFISPPSMMMRKSVLNELNGYDENLDYEDFDFWIRSSRTWEYSFTNEILVEKRVVKGSLSSKQFQFRNKYQWSTLKVCQKIKELNQNKEEDLALKKRCWYEIRQCLKHGNLELIPRFLKLV